MDNNLFIGLIDSDNPIDDQTSDGLAFKTNKIGGYPVLSSNAGQHLTTSFESLVCDSCRKRLTYVLQILCPIDDSATDRLIYLFVCLNCTPNKWFAIRTITSFVDIKQSKTNSSEVWIDGETDWGNQDIEEDIDCSANTCAESLSNLSVECSPKSATHQSIGVTSMAFFRPLYISVIEEPDSRGTNDKHINHLIESYHQRSDDKKAGSSKEAYEQNFLESIYRNDRKNYEFFKRLSICPNQVIRYQWMGTPLLNSDRHKPKALKCESCGADRVFELQLMPALITYLRPLNTSTSPDIDFGTVLIYSCGQNCRRSEEYLSFEQTIVLSDPDNEFIDKIKLNKVK